MNLQNTPSESGSPSRHYLKALHETALAIMKRRNLSELLQDLLVQAAQLVHAEHGEISFVDEQNQRLVTKAAVGLLRDKNLMDFEVPYGKGLTGQVWQQQKPIVISSYRTWEKGIVDLSNENIWAGVGIPFIRNDRVYGVLALFHDHDGRIFDDEEVELLTHFAELAVIAIDNATLHEAIEQELHERRQTEASLNQFNQALKALYSVSVTITSTLELSELLHQLVELTQHIFPQASLVTVQLLNHNNQTMHTQAAYPRLKKYPEPLVFRPNHGIAGYALQERCVVNVGDVTKDPRFIQGALHASYHSLLVAPLIAGDKVWGTLSISAQPTDAFSMNDETMADLLARQAAVAIEKAYLYKAERDERLMAEALGQSAGIINSRLSLQEVLKSILDFIAKVIPHDTANVVLIKPDQRVWVAGIRGTGVDYALEHYINTHILHVNDFATYRWMQIHKKPLIIPNVNDYAGWISLPNSEWIRSYASVPIRNEDQIIGFLNLNSQQNDYFGSQLAGRLQAFADQAGVAIHNAQLFESEQMQRYIADTLRDIGLVLARETIGSEHIAAKVLQQVRRIIPYNMARLWLQDEQGMMKSVESVGAEIWLSPRTLQSFYSEFPFQSILELRDVVIISDTTLSPSAFYGEMASWAGIPIFSRHQLIGVLELGHGEKNFFRSETVPVLASLIAQISTALENANLVEQIHRYTDVLEQRVAERTATLERERSQLKAILDAMTEGVVYSEHNPDSQTLEIRYVNSAFCRLTGYSDERSVGKSLSQVLSTLLRTDMYDQLLKLGEKFNHILDNGHVIRQSHVKIYTYTETTLDVSITLTTSFADDNNKLWEVMLLRDISQEMELEKQKSRFVANASHELRTPLTNLKTRTYLLRNQPENMERHLTVIDQTIERMTHLVEDLLDISRFERGFVPIYPTLIVLQDIITEVVALQRTEAARRQIRIDETLPEEPVQLFADPKRITQVVTNLVVNAINYNKEEGNIQIHLTTQDQMAIFSVQDTGIGIADDQIQQIFEPFVRASSGKTTGTGLGLTIAKEIVELHQGTIEVESRLYQGSIFRVKLPIYITSESPSS